MGANDADLLGSTNIVSKKNPSMSKLFMLYQLFAIISAILAPATICLMVAGSLSFLLNIPAAAAALVISVIPPAIYLGLCFKLKADTQITIAAVLSVLYAFLMMVVTIFIITSMVKEKTILTPSSIFIVSMSIIYIVTALMHPQELPLVFYGILYIACIPSAYLLLTICSMVNMNSVSWGTRETKPAAEAATTAATVQQTKSQKAKTTLKRLCSWMKCCKTSNQRSEDERPSIRQENLNPEPTQPEPQPQNTIVDDASDNEQEKRRQFLILQLSDENQFWKELIERYLKPLQNDKEKQEQIKNDLQDLRNKIHFSFFILNAFWLVAAFTFQAFEVFSIQINSVDMNLNQTGGKIQIEPMSLMFIVCFALSVLLQFIGMLYHRIATFIHYVAFLETEPKQQKSATKKRKQKDSTSNADSSSGFGTNIELSTITQKENEVEMSDEADSEDELSEWDIGERAG